MSRLDVEREICIEGRHKSMNASSILVAQLVVCGKQELCDTPKLDFLIGCLSFDFSSDAFPEILTCRERILFETITQAGIHQVKE